MKVLKFILWPILLFCIVWIGAIFFGPTLISSATSYFSDGKVNLTRVKISPKLEVSVAVVDFAAPLGPDGRDLNGVLRALKVDWKIKNGFEVIGSIGPSSLVERGTVSSTSFRLEPASILDWSEVNVQLEFEQLVGTSFGMERGRFIGKLTNGSQDLKDVELVLQKIHGGSGENFFQSAASRVTLEHYQIRQPINNQKLDIEYSLQDIAFPEIALTAGLAEGDLSLLKGDVLVNALLADIKLTKQHVKANALNLSIKHVLSADNFEGVLEFSFSEVASKDPAISIEKYSGYVTATASSISHSGQAVVSKLELETNELFIAEIDKSILDFTLDSWALPSGTGVKGQVLLTLEEATDFKASAVFETSLSEINPIKCIRTRCNYGNLGAQYKIVASEASLLGNLTCSRADCFNQSVQHEVQTDDTNKFFEAVSLMGIVSPLVLPLAFIAISNGEPVGDGHLVRF